MIRSSFLIILSLSCFVAKKSYIINGPIWKAEIQSCNSWGAYEQTYNYDLPDLSSIGVNYEDLDELTTVVAHFEAMVIHTKAVDDADLSKMWLSEYKGTSENKEYTSKVKYTAVCGWGKQICWLRLTVNVRPSGKVTLRNYVYAASWGAVSCATTRSNVHSIQIIN